MGRAATSPDWSATGRDAACFYGFEDAAVRELLWRVLERVGRLEHFCLEKARMVGRTVEDARDSEERDWLVEQERNFVGYCPRELDSIARSAIEFAVALWIQCSPDWEEPSQSVGEARTELVSELQIAVVSPVPPVRARVSRQAARHR